MPENSFGPSTTEQAHTALRAFLQRGEARLSTMHGMAGAFVGGAGLLSLLPLFYINTLEFFVGLLLERVLRIPFDVWWLAGTLAWAIIIVFSLYIPTYAFYLLIRQLVVLYFVPHSEEGSSLHVLPRLALSALSSPLDDPAERDGSVPSKIKLSVIEATYSPKLLNILIPRSANSEERQNLNELAKCFEELTTSTIEERQRVRNRLDGKRDDYQPYMTKAQIGVGAAYDVRATLAGLQDRTLVQEAARLEVALVRINSQLRVLLVRYVKSILAFVWTIVALMVSLSIVKKFPAQADMICLDIGMFWATLNPFVVSLPIKWLIKIGDQNSLPSSFRKDLDLTHFEDSVWRLSLYSGLVSLVGVASFASIPALAYWQSPYLDATKRLVGIDVVSGIPRSYYMQLALAVVLLIILFASVVRYRTLGRAA